MFVSLTTFNEKSVNTFYAGAASAGGWQIAEHGVAFAASASVADRVAKIARCLFPLL